MIRSIPPAYLFALGVLGALAMARFIFLLPFALLDDEAYYWTWALVPSAAYFDHTAGIGLLGWAWQQLFGFHFIGFRVLLGLLSLIAGLASLAACLTLMPPEHRTWSLTPQSWARGAGLIALVLATSTVQMAHTFWIPDAVFLPFFTLAIWQVCRLLSPYERAHRRAWGWAGLFFGLAMLGKEIVVLYAGLFSLIALTTPRLRQDLRASLWPWIGLFLMILGGLPTLIWNAQHDWVFIKFQSGNAFTTLRQGGGLKETLDLLSTYALLLGPAFALSIPQLRNSWQKWPALWLLFLLPSALFFSLALYRGLIASWALPSIHIGLILFLALAIPGALGRWRWSLLLGGGILCLLVIASAIRPVATQAANTMPAMIWPDLYAQMTSYQTRAQSTADEPVLILANSYQDASQLNYFRTKANGFIPVLSGPAEARTALPALNIASRSNHYDLIWQDLDLGGYLALFIQRKAAFPPAEAFEQILDEGHFETDGDPFAYRFGRLVDQPRPQIKPPKAD